MTAQSILERLVVSCPDFGAYWNDPGNCFREDDGSFTIHGVFADFSGYFREQYEQLPRGQEAALGALVSEWAASTDEDLANATATCFLENVSGERCSRDLRQRLHGEALRYFLRWDNSA